MIVRADSFRGFYDTETTVSSLGLDKLGTYQYGDLPRQGVESAAGQLTLEGEALTAARLVMSRSAQLRPPDKKPFAQLLHDNIQQAVEMPVGASASVDQDSSWVLLRLAMRLVQGSEGNLHEQRQAEVVKLCWGLYTLDKQARHMREHHVVPLARAARDLEGRSIIDRNAGKNDKTITWSQLITGEGDTAWDQLVACGLEQGVRLKAIEIKSQKGEEFFQVGVTSYIDNDDLYVKPPRGRRSRKRLLAGLPKLARPHTPSKSLG